MNILTLRVVNLENHPGWGPAIAKHTAQPWPRNYQGPPRLIVPTVRSVVNAGESLALKVIALDNEAVKSVTVHLRPLDRGKWRTLAAAHQARAVWQAKLPPAAEDFEYFVQARTTAAKTLRWPASAPHLNQTVVILDAAD